MNDRLVLLCPCWWRHVWVFSECCLSLRSGDGLLPLQCVSVVSNCLLGQECGWLSILVCVSYWICWRCMWSWEVVSMGIVGGGKAYKSVAQWWNVVLYLQSSHQSLSPCLSAPTIPSPLSAPTISLSLYPPGRSRPSRRWDRKSVV